MSAFPHSGQMNRALANPVIFGFLFLSDMLVHRGKQCYIYKSFTGKQGASVDRALQGQPGTRFSLSSVTHVLSSLRKVSYFMSGIQPNL